MNDIPRPLVMLRDAKHRYPGAWRQFDEFRQDREALGGWPEWCYCPMAGAYAIVSGGGDHRIPLERMGEVPTLAALAAWRVGQGIYRFDPDLFAALVATPLTGDLPPAVLFRLPEWCVYIETPGLTWPGARGGEVPLLGFFAHLEYDATAERDEMRLLIDSGSGLAACPIHIGRWSLEESIGNAVKVGMVNAREHGLPYHGLVPAEAKQGAALVEPLVSLLLYLCAEEPDYAGEDRPEHPRPTRTRHGWKLFPPDQPRTWEVGVRLGAALRRARDESRDPGPGTGTHASPRGHVRRAHWHTFRHGPGRSETRVKWLPPIPVNLPEIEDGPAVIRPVK